MCQIKVMKDKVISAEICSQMVESATRACQPMISVPPEQGNPNWDAMAVALASQANAISITAAVLGVIFAVAGWGWGKIVAADARAIAEQEAQSMENLPQRAISKSGSPKRHRGSFRLMLNC